MAGEFTVRPEDLETTGKAMDSAGTDLHGQWQQLKAATQGIKFGNTDTVGPLIQMTLMVRSRSPTPASGRRSPR
jgi:hypothetical protein